jgi:hypothetical protein
MIDIRFLAVVLQFYNVLGLRAAIALNNVEFNALTFVQSLETVALDRAEVNENVVSAFNLNKSETFLRIKPLDSSNSSHEVNPPKKCINMQVLFTACK